MMLLRMESACDESLSVCIGKVVACVAVITLLFVFGFFRDCVDSLHEQVEVGDVGLVIRLLFDILVGGDCGLVIRLLFDILVGG